MRLAKQDAANGHSLRLPETRRIARKAPSLKGCGKIERSLCRPPGHCRPGYNLRRAPRDHLDFPATRLMCDLFRASLKSELLHIFEKQIPVDFILVEQISADSEPVFTPFISSLNNGIDIP